MVEVKNDAHTPGPWRVDPRDQNSSTVRAGEKPIAEVWLNGDDHLANARLIAAAPDLLAVVKLGRQKLATYTSVYEGDKELRMLLEKWDEAISKASSNLPSASQEGGE